ASDVQNPLLGSDGAAAVYAPQKGADPQEVQQLESGLKHLVRQLAEIHPDAAELAERPAAGAAGGLGFAAMLLGARIASGADHFLDLLGFDRAAAGCDLVITGEGRIDSQTLSGKLPAVVAHRAAPARVEAVVGHNALGADTAPEAGIARIRSLSERTQADCARDTELSRALLVEIGREIGAELAEGADQVP
ncbi:MAG: glycerate kinase, partial [Micrococcales bacterium]|nr:glycerate kinase [Micrococcales bacterium]